MYITHTIFFAFTLFVLSHSIHYNDIADIYIPESNIVVNTNKGFVLGRVGSYSRKYDRGIIHTFIPLKNTCTFLPNNEVCLTVTRISKKNFIELGTVLSWHKKDHSIIPLKQKDISILVRRDVINILSSHRPGEFISNVTSNFHFFDNQFYIVIKKDLLGEETVPGDDRNNLEITHYHDKMTPTVLFEQLRNRKIGFDFLQTEDIDVILRPMMSTIDSSYVNKGANELAFDFNQLIVSQTVNVFRSCSIGHDDSVFPPCLIVSTLFVRPSSLPEDLYVVYNLHPISIHLNEFQYRYTNLPKTIGFNMIDHTLIIFDDQYTNCNCVFSKVVQCTESPIPMSFASSPCLSDLFTIHKKTKIQCDLARSHYQQPEISPIIENIWIFNVLTKPHRCQLISQQTASSDVIVVDEPTIVQLPCEQTLRCSGVDLITAHCAKSTLMVNSENTGRYHQQTNFTISLKQLAFDFMNAYTEQLRSSFNEIQNTSKVSPTKLFFNQSTYFFQSLALLFALILLATIGKLIQRKLGNQLNEVERQINNISDIFLPNLRLSNI